MKKNQRVFAYALVVTVALCLTGCQALLNLINPKSSDDRLANLTLASGTLQLALTPSFQASTLTYTVDLPNATTSVVVSASPYDNGASVLVSPSNALVVGVNTITITVKAADGKSTRVYTIAATRAAPVSNSASLASLSVDTGSLSPAFAAATFSYSVTVPQAATSISISATAVTGATVVGASTKALALTDSSWSFPIVVTAADGSTTNTYTIAVTRAAASNPTRITIANPGFETVGGSGSSAAPASWILESVQSQSSPNLGAFTWPAGVIDGNWAGDAMYATDASVSNKSTGHGLSQKVSGAVFAAGRYTFTAWAGTGANATAPAARIVLGYDAGSSSFTELAHLDTALPVGNNLWAKQVLIYDVPVGSAAIGKQIWISLASVAEGASPVNHDAVELWYDANPPTQQSTDASLSGISFFYGPWAATTSATFTPLPGFSSSTGTYQMTVPVGTNFVGLRATTTDAHASVLETQTPAIAGGDGLVDGLNSFTFSVTAQSGATQLYSVNVTRQSPAVSVIVPNASFETNGGSNGSLPGTWIVDPTKVGVYGSYPAIMMDGNWALYENWTQGGVDAGVTQTLSTSFAAGKYTLSAWASTGNNPAPPGRVTIGYIGSGSNFLPLAHADTAAIGINEWDRAAATITLAAGDTAIGKGITIKLSTSDTTVSGQTGQNWDNVQLWYENYPAANRSSDSSLSDLQVYSGSDSTTASFATIAGFSAGTTNYSYTVPAGATFFTLRPTPSSIAAGVAEDHDIFFGSSLPYTFHVTVTSEDGTSTTVYSINVHQ